jgi:multidrug efflux system membrane fusion protein
VAGVRRQDIRITLQAIGTVGAANTAVVRAKIEGELKAIHFKEGQQVRAGALLAELDNRAQQIALAQTEGQLARDQAQLANARLDLARFKDLLAKDGIARQQVDTQEALVRQLQGTVQTDQALVENARLQLSYTRITAPIAGRIGLKLADLGNVVRPSDASGLLSIAQVQPASVVFAVPDQHLPRISEALHKGRPLKVEAWDRDQKRLLATGQVTSTDNAIDAATSTIKLKAVFPNADLGLYPNQFVNVRLQLGSLDGVLAVPAAALMRNADGQYVYLVGEDRSVSMRPVRIEATDGDWVGIQADLQPGDQVVTDGVDRLRDGARVDIIQPGRRERGRRDGAVPGASAPAAAGRSASTAS